MCIIQEGMPEAGEGQVQVHETSNSTAGSNLIETGRKEEVEVVRLMLHWEAVSEDVQFGMTALHFASRNGNLELIRLLAHTRECT